MGHLDTPEHVTDGKPCWCYPRIEHTEGGDLIIHRSWAEILKQRDEMAIALKEAERALINIQVVRELDMSLVEVDPKEVEAHVLAHPGPVLAVVQQALAKAEQQ